MSCRIGTDRVKKGAGERNYMDWLKEILGEAHTEDIDKKIAGYIGKNFVSKSDFRAETDKVKSLEGQITERDSQLEALKKIDTAGLQSKITELQEENRQAKAKLCVTCCKRPISRNTCIDIFFCRFFVRFCMVY